MRSIIAFVICVFIVYAGESESQTKKSQKHYLKYQYSSYSDDADYYLDCIHKVSLTAKESISTYERSALPVRWGIVSHHLLIKDLIAEFFFQLSKLAQPKTIIIIGPDHFFRGRFPISISELEWKTPFGLIKPDMKTIQKLCKTQIIQIDENAFYNEHSIGALVPFIKYYFSESRIVTILIRPDADINSAKTLAKLLSSTKKEEVLLIASLDFSHKKTSLVAQQEDSVTIDIIRQFESKRYKEAFVDSRIALFIVLESCRQMNASQVKIIHHTNSAIWTRKLQELCTSYFNLFIR